MDHPRRNIEIDEESAARAEPSSRYRQVTSAAVAPDFFDVLDTSILSGRTFDSGDLRPGAAPAVITLANGEVLEGTVQGRDLTRRSGAEGDVAIRMLDGRDIAAIDRTAIRASGESVMLVGMNGATQEDVLQGLIFWDDGRRLKVGQGVVREVGSPGKSSWASTVSMRV
jgi:hypothetical protein